MKADPDQNEVLASRIIEVLSRYSNRWLSVRSICIQIGRDYGEEPTSSWFWKPWQPTATLPCGRKRATAGT